MYLYIYVCIHMSILTWCLGRCMVCSRSGRQYVRYHLDFALGDTSQEKNAMQRYLWGEAIAKHIGKLEHEEPVTYVAFSETIRDDV